MCGLVQGAASVRGTLRYVLLSFLFLSDFCSYRLFRNFLQEQRYTGVIKLNKASNNMKGEDIEEMYVTRIIPHNNYVWCAVGTLIIRVDPKVCQML